MRTDLPAAPHYRPAPRTLAALRGLAIAGGLVFVAGLFVAPDRAWTGFLIGFVYLTGLALAGLVFLSVLYMANAGWATALRRIPEAMAGVVPWAGALGLVLLVGVPTLYEWSRAAVVEADPILLEKSVYLNHLFFAVRLVVCFGAWFWFASTFIRRSRRQDLGEAGERGQRRRNIATSAAFMAVLVVTWSLASFDWLMSLEPHWFSTIYALYTLAGLGSAGLAGAVVVLIVLRRSGALSGYLRVDHLHDLGKLLFSFSVLWVYIWYCQYMLIWYTDIPEETGWYLARQAGSWGSLQPISLALNWLVPFLVLLSRAARRSERVLWRVSWILLVGHAFDLLLLAGPPLMGEAPRLGLWEIAPVVGAVAFFFYRVLWSLSRSPLVPLRDPRLAESLSYHSG